MNQRGMRFPNAKRVFVFFGGPRMASASWKACLLRALHASDALREKSILCVWVQWLAALGETKCTEAKPPRAITKKKRRRLGGGRVDFFKPKRLKTENGKKAEK